jgi:outer membrane protein assembly factor BamD
VLVRAYDRLGMTDLRDDALRVFDKNFPKSTLLADVQRR